MAKYYDSHWGIIIGKIGKCVGYRYKGKNIVRMHFYPTQRSSRELVQKIKNHKASIKELSIPQSNHNMVFSSLMAIGKKIAPLWKKEAKIKNLTPLQLFMKVNVPKLYYSIQNRKTKLISPKNPPNMCSILLTYGMLEPAIISQSKYDKSTGTAQINWDPIPLMNGTPDDLALIFAIYWKLHPLKLPDFDIHHSLKFYSNPPLSQCRSLIYQAKCRGLIYQAQCRHESMIRPQPSLIGWVAQELKDHPQRKNASAKIQIQKKLNPKYLTLYLSFYNKNIGFSPSTPSPLTPWNPFSHPI